MDHDEEKIEGLPSLTEEEFLDLAEDVAEIEKSMPDLDKGRNANFDALNSILSEYLDSWIIIGYTAEGNEVVSNKMTTPRDTRSLTALLEEISMSTILEIDSDFEIDDEE